MALGPFFESRQTGQTDGLSVTGILPSEQPVADQQRDTTLADLDRGNHDNAPGAALAEASCTGGGCRFMGHVTGCYYGINGEFCTTFGYGFGLSLFGPNPAQGPLLTDHGATLGET